MCFLHNLSLTECSDSTVLWVHRAHHSSADHCREWSPHLSIGVFTVNFSFWRLTRLFHSSIILTAFFITGCRSTGAAVRCLERSSVYHRSDIQRQTFTFTPIGNLLPDTYIEFLWNHAPVSPTWNLFQCFCCIKLLQPYSKWMDSATAKRQIDLRFSCNTVSKTIPVCQWTTLFAFVSITQTSTRKHLLQKGSYNVERLGVTLVVAWESKSILSALNSHLDITYMKHKWMQNLQAEWIGLF